MIQRVQSLYLGIAAILLLSLLFFDLVWVSPASEAFAWFTPAILAITGVLAVAAFVAIVLYRNRQRQKRVVEILQYGTLLFMVMLYGLMYAAGDLHFMRAGQTDVGKILAMAAPVLAYICFYLARRGIASDIALVRSMDRLR